MANKRTIANQSTALDSKQTDCEAALSYRKQHSTYHKRIYLYPNFVTLMSFSTYFQISQLFLLYDFIIITLGKGSSITIVHIHFIQSPINISDWSQNASHLNISTGRSSRDPLKKNNSQWMNTTYLYDIWKHSKVNVVFPNKDDEHNYSECCYRHPQKFVVTSMWISPSFFTEWMWLPSAVCVRFVTIQWLFSMRS